MVLNKSTVPNQKTLGFTLPEVILALVVIGIFLALSGRFFLEQWRTSQALKDRLEAHFSVMNSGRTLSDAIRGAKSVTWDSVQRILSVVPSTETSPDKYSIADLNYDGIKDLYVWHKDVPSPVASGLVSWNCEKGDGDVWTVTLEAKIGNQIVTWQGSMRQRINLNLVLFCFSSRS